jgi:hypothetical protein
MKGYLFFTVLCSIAIGMGLVPLLNGDLGYLLPVSINVVAVCLNVSGIVKHVRLQIAKQRIN